MLALTWLLFVEFLLSDFSAEEVNLFGKSCILFLENLHSNLLTFYKMLTTYSGVFIWFPILTPDRRNPFIPQLFILRKPYKLQRTAFHLSICTSNTTTAAGHI